MQGPYANASLNLYAKLHEVNNFSVVYILQINRKIKTSKQKGWSIHADYLHDQKDWEGIKHLTESKVQNQKNVYVDTPN